MAAIAGDLARSPPISASPAAVDEEAREALVEGEVVALSINCPRMGGGDILRRGSGPRQGPIRGPRARHTPVGEEAEPRFGETAGVEAAVTPGRSTAPADLQKRACSPEEEMLRRDPSQKREADVG
jgi:hypothetical protein